MSDLLPGMTLTEEFEIILHMGQQLEQGSTGGSSCVYVCSLYAVRVCICLRF